MYNDADIEQAEMEAVGNAYAAARAAGRCTHGGVQGANPDRAPDLRPGQLRCTEGCGAVFGSDLEWLDAIHEAID